MGTKIEWADETWNPLVGCSPVSEACENCYALRMAVRLAHMKDTECPYDQLVTNKRTGTWEWTGEIVAFPARLDQPKHWETPRRVFLGSMTDLLHQNVPPGALVDVLRVCECCPQHTFLLLTKRPQNILRGLSAHWVAALRNVWWGATVENQSHEDRIIHLLRVPAAVHFVSLEPLLGPVDFVPYLTDWVIVGCETGPHRRHTDIAWIRSVVRQCRDAGVPCFVKAIEVPRRGGMAPGAYERGPVGSGAWEAAIKKNGGRVSKDMSEWPADLRVREFPAGRV